jgi:hypothetical protein
MNTYGVEKGTTIRVPSTANLMIDSADRNVVTYPNPFSFQITRPQAILNGFFSRIGATEMVFEWLDGNVSNVLGNQTILLDLSGEGANTYRAQRSIQLAGNYTVAAAMLAIAEGFDDLSGTTGIGFQVIQDGAADVRLEATGGQFQVLNTLLARQLGFDQDDFYDFVLPDTPDLRPYRYLDFVCENLTAVQDVKDSATNTYNRDVLLRWYFADDVPEDLDQFGYPILMGYLPFTRRRIFNPPKQIKWEQNIPVGNLTFSVYDPQGNLAAIQDAEWLMTLQLSEN